MKTRIVFVSLVAIVALLGLVMYAGAEEKRAKAVKAEPNMMGTKSCPRAGENWPCMMCCSAEGREKCKAMGMSEAMMDRCSLMMRVCIRSNDPESLLAMQKELSLSEEQVSRLKSIAEKSWQEADAVLTAEQKDKVDKLAGTPETMIKMYEEMMQKMHGKGAGEKAGAKPPVEEPNKPAEPNIYQSGEKKEVTLSAGSGVTFTSQPKYEKPKSYDSTATTTWEGKEYKIHVAMVNIPTGGGFQMPCLEAEQGSIYIASASEMQALLGTETTLHEGTDPKATDKPIAATLEPIEGKILKATAGTDGMHIGIDLMAGQMNLGDGLACDIKTFGRKVVLQAGSLNIKGVQYTITAGAYILASEGKLIAYGVKRSQ